MNKKNLFSGAGTVLLVSVMGVSAASAAMVSYEMVSDKVEIHLETYQEENGIEKPWTEDTEILPGDELSRIPRIFNDGVDCYVRARVQLENSGTGVHSLSEDNIRDISPGWIKTGEYYYYTDVLESGKSTDIFRKIYVPSDWEQTDEEEQWKLNIDAEAVQAEHFTPDFTKKDPWMTKERNLEVENSTDDKVPEHSGKKDAVILEIYKDMESVDLKEGEMIRSLDTFLPGDRRTGSITLCNRGKTGRTVRCRIEADEENEFLKKLQITVKTIGEGRSRILYEGSLFNGEMGEVSFSEYIEGEKNSDIEFEIMLPEDAGNEYSAKKGNIRFYFTTDQPEPQPYEKTGKEAGPPRVVEKVRTGDHSSDTAAAGFIISALLMSVSVFLYAENRRRLEKDEK